MCVCVIAHGLFVAQINEFTVSGNLEPSEIKFTDHSSDIALIREAHQHLHRGKHDDTLQMLIYNS